MGARGTAVVVALAVACGGKIDEDVGTMIVGGPSPGSPERPEPTLTPSPMAPLDGGRPLDAASGDAGCAVATPPATTCPAPPPASFTYVAAAPHVAACTDADITFFSDTIHGSVDVTPAQLEKAMAERSASCASCIFTDACAPAWSPFVFTDVTRTAGFVDFGGCLEHAGAALACASAVQAQQRCLDAVCPFAVCGSASATCRQKAQSPSGACPPGPVSTACAGGDVTVLESACQDAVAVVRASCGPADAGP